VIPNTISLIAGAPNREAARRLREFLLTPAVEGMLANCPSKQMPLHPKAKAEGVPVPKHAMKVDFAKAAEVWDEAMEFVKTEFAG